MPAPHPRPLSLPPSTPAQGEGRHTPSRVSPTTEVLLIGFTPSAVATLTALFGGSLEVIAVADPGEALRRFSPERTAVLCIGPGSDPDQALAMLSQVAANDPRRRTQNVVLAAGSQLQRFQELVDDDRLFYLCGQPPVDADVARIVTSAATVRRGISAPRDDAEVLAETRVLALAARLARESTPAAVSRAAGHEIESLADADQGVCLLYDRVSETLWVPPGGGGRPERRESVVAGLVSFAVRTGRPLAVERVGADPRYEPEADNDGGPADQRLLAVPALASGGDVEAVLVALRDGAGESFGDREQRLLGLLADQLAPIFGRLRRREALEHEAARRHDAFGGSGAGIFRAEALDHYTRGLSDQGNLVEMSPSWMRWSFRLVLALVVTGFLFAAIGTVDEYAEGTAVVRVEESTEPLTPARISPSPGRVGGWAGRGGRGVRVSERAVVMLLPGRYRPLLAAGMPMRLELEGYPYAYQHLTVDAVSDGVLGPAEARQLLGPDVGDVISIPGQVVLVHAALPQATFESGGRSLPYHDGLLGRVEIRVRSEPILLTLFPGLRALFDG